MAEMADEDLALLRTHAFFLIDGVVRTDKGHNSRSTKLSYELTGFFTEGTHQGRTGIVFAGFPVSKRGETLCTPLGAKVILNFLAVFGTEQFIEGNTIQRSEALFSLHKYAMMIPSKQVLDGPFLRLKAALLTQVNSYSWTTASWFCVNLSNLMLKANQRSVCKGTSCARRMEATGRSGGSCG